MEQDHDDVSMGGYVLWEKFVRLGEKGYAAEAVETRRTKEGIQRRELKVRPGAAGGKGISREGVSGICSVCHLFECQDHFFLCMQEGCRRSLCIVHARFLQVANTIVAFCSSCYEYALLNQDTWRLPLLPPRIGYDRGRLEDQSE